MCREVQNEFKNLFVQLNFKFYITDENFSEDQLIDNWFNRNIMNYNQ